MFKIYHNPRCSKSRNGLKYLEESGYEFEVIEYFKNPLTEMELTRLLIKLNKKPLDIIRTQEPAYRSELKGKNFTDEEWIKILVNEPKLILRPIIESRYKAIIGNPPDNIKRLL